MYTEVSLLLFFQFCYFFVALFVAFYIPGFIVTKTLQLSSNNKHALAFLTGMGLWGAVGMISGYLNVRFLVYAYLGICLILFFRDRRYFFQMVKNCKRPDVTLIVIIIAGTFIHFISVGFMNLHFFGRFITCCGHVPDNHLFIALTNELVNRFPPYEPGVYGAPLQNYHFLSHLVVADLIRVFRLPLLSTTYQFLPIILSISYGIAGIVFSSVLQLSSNFKRWLLFFFYFGADAVFLFVLLLNKQFLFYFAAMESGAGFLYNYPRAFSIILLITGITWFILWHKKKRLTTGLLIIAVFATNISYKAFTGIFIWVGLVAIGLVSFFQRDFKRWCLCVATVGIGYLIHISVSKESGGMFFSGLWRVHDFFAMPELGLSHHLLARQIFVDHQNWPRIIFLDVLFMGIFLWVTFGSKIIGFVQTKKSLSRFPIFLHLFFVAGSAVSFIIGMFFLQTLGGSVTVNFLITVFLILSFYSALTMAYVIPQFTSKRIAMLLGILMIVMTLPRAIYVTYENIVRIQKQPKFAENVQFFADIRTKTNNEALIAPLGFALDYENLWMTYYTDRSLYISGNFRGPGVQKLLPTRMETISLLETSTQTGVIRETLQQENITHILWRKGTNFPLKDDTFLFEEVTESPVYSLYEFKE